MKDTVLNTLQLIRAIHDQPSAGAVIAETGLREKVVLAPKTLEQLAAAIDLERKRVVPDEYVTVVVIRNGVVDESFLFVGSHDMIAASAEAKFREIVQADVGKPIADMEAVLDDGYYEFKGGGSVCLTWPTHDECTTTGKRGIKACITGDGSTVEVEFDAVPWFEQASDEEIEELAEIGWGGNYEADVVAEFVADTVPSVRKVIDKGAGFEVHVDVAQALRWLAEHRASLCERISE
jgi:hypothetical protein